MNLLKKVTLYNLLVLLVYSLWIRFASTGNEQSFSILILSAFVIAIHVIIMLVISGVYYASGNKDVGKAFLLSSGIVLLIGFSSCWANASI